MIAYMTKKRKEPARPHPTPEPVIPLATPEDVRLLREGIRLTVEQAAEKIGVLPRTWRSWEQPSQKRQPSDSHKILIRLMARKKL